MKKFIALLLMATMAAANVSAQNQRSAWTLNTRAWSTNYFTTLIGDAASVLITAAISDDDLADSLLVRRIIPLPSTVFPVGMKKSGFDDPYDIYSPYHRAFSNPFKHIGDYAIGIDASWQPSFVGLYAGAYFKSQEIVFKETDDNLRGFYFQPRMGITLGGLKSSFEAGVFYDIVTGCKGSGALDIAGKDELENGLGLDFAFTQFDKGKHSSFTVQCSMPLHNMLNSSSNIPYIRNAKRRVAYIMVTRRIAF